MNLTQLHYVYDLYTFPRSTQYLVRISDVWWVVHRDEDDEIRDQFNNDVLWSDIKEIYVLL